MKVYLATWIGEEGQGRALTSQRENNRLVSYYFIMEQKIDRQKFVKYCKTIK